MIFYGAALRSRNADGQSPKYKNGGLLMKCDKCGEDIIGTVITKSDGKQWCYKCTKAEKYPENFKRAKTKDKRVLLARKFRSMRDDFPASGYFLVYQDKFSYTNGVVLMTDMDTVPNKYKCSDVDTLWKTDKQIFPNIEKVLKLVKGGIGMIIPEEFYRYASAFKNVGKMRVKIRKDGIYIDDSFDESSMSYREFSAPLLVMPVDFSLGYFMALKPREIILRGNKVASIESSYDKTIAAFKHVLLMPMELE